MIKFKTKSGNVFLNVLSIVSVEQCENGDVKIWCAHQGATDTTEHIDLVVYKIEEMLIRIAGGMRV